MTVNACENSSKCTFKKLNCRICTILKRKRDRQKIERGTMKFPRSKSCFTEDGRGLNMFIGHRPKLVNRKMLKITLNKGNLKIYFKPPIDIRYLPKMTYK